MTLFEAVFYIWFFVFFIFSNIYVLCTMTPKQMYKDLIRSSDAVLKVIYIIALFPAWFITVVKTAVSKV